jgi:hypothetical protein
MGDPGTRLQMAVECVMDKLPNKKRALSGWMDLNYDFLEGSIEERNVASRRHAQTKTEEARQELKAARIALKKKKNIANNRWFGEMLKACTVMG